MDGLLGAIYSRVTEKITVQFKCFDFECRRSWEREIREKRRNGLGFLHENRVNLDFLKEYRKNQMDFLDEYRKIQINFSKEVRYHDDKMHVTSTKLDGAIGLKAEKEKRKRKERMAVDFLEILIEPKETRKKQIKLLEEALDYGNKMLCLKK